MQETPPCYNTGWFKINMTHLKNTLEWGNNYVLGKYLQTVISWEDARTQETKLMLKY